MTPTVARLMQQHAERMAEIAIREAPDRWWCRCGWHRARRDGGLCPSCEDIQRNGRR